jgi:hypothetical protein
MGIVKHMLSQQQLMQNGSVFIQHTMNNILAKLDQMEKLKYGDVVMVHQYPWIIQVFPELLKLLT